MARLAVVTAVLLMLCAVAAGAADHHFRSKFDEENPISLVTDGLRELESSVLRLIGDARHAHAFARFAHRSVFSFLAVESADPC